MEVSTCFSSAPCRVSWQRKKKAFLASQCSILSPLSVVLCISFMFKLAHCWEGKIIKSCTAMARGLHLRIVSPVPSVSPVLPLTPCSCRCCKSHCTWGGQPQHLTEVSQVSQVSQRSVCLSEVFASGVHHFCQHDRAFKEAGSFARRFLFDLLLVCLFLIQFLMIKDVLG